MQCSIHKNCGFKFYSVFFRCILYYLDTGLAWWRLKPCFHTPAPFYTNLPKILGVSWCLGSAQPLPKCLTPIRHPLVKIAPFLHKLYFSRLPGAAHTGLRGKGSQITNVVFFSPKVARYDIVALDEWEGVLSCVKIKQYPYGPNWEHLDKFRIKMFYQTCCRVWLFLVHKNVK